MVSDICTIAFPGKDRLKILFYLSCFTGLIFQKAICGERKHFCTCKIGEFLIFNTEICAVQFPGKTSECEIQHGKQMCQIPHIRTRIVEILGTYLPKRNTQITSRFNLNGICHPGAYGHISLKKLPLHTSPKSICSSVISPVYHFPDFLNSFQ